MRFAGRRRTPQVDACRPWLTHNSKFKNHASPAPLIGHVLDAALLETELYFGPALSDFLRVTRFKLAQFDIDVYVIRNL